MNQGNNMDMSQVSTILGILSAVAMGLWKLFSISRQNELLETRLTALEGRLKDTDNDMFRLDEKITNQLMRIETKLDTFILQK